MTFMLKFDRIPFDLDKLIIQGGAMTPVALPLARP